MEEALSSPPEENNTPKCCFGASKKQTFGLKVVIACIMGFAFFGVVMTDDHNLRFVFAIIGATLVLLSYGVGMALFKYLNVERHTELDWEDEIENIILSDKPNDTLWQEQEILLYNNEQNTDDQTP